MIFPQLIFELSLPFDLPLALCCELMGSLDVWQQEGRGLVFRGRQRALPISGVVFFIMGEILGEAALFEADARALIHYLDEARTICGV